MNLLNDLNPDQKQAVTHTGTPLLILAGAGSGKTRALTYRAAYLISQQGVAADNILLTTFTNKAAGEMQARLMKLTGKKLPYAGTFHSLCARFLRIHGDKLGIGNDFVIYDTDDQIDAIKQVIVELGLDPQTIKPRSVAAAIDSAKNELIGAGSYREYARGSFQQIVSKIYLQYQLKLRDYHALDFTDLLVEAVRLFTDHADVRDRYRHQFLHILIDEYQDTNKAQYALTKLWLGDHHNLCVVGDASQAIYSWRGADYHNLLALQTDFPNLTTIKLEQNYRSTQNILDAAYGVIHRNQLHPILELWTESHSGEPVHLYEAKNEYDEARYCAKQILSYHEQGHPLASSAVLFRTNAQSRVFEEVFLEQGIPYVLVGGFKFYERREVKDVVAYLRFAFNSHDKVSLARIEKLGKRRLQTFLTWLETADINQTPRHLLDSVLQASGYLGKYDPHDLEDQTRIENVQELKSVAESFTNVGEFLENLSLAEQDTRKSTDSDGAVLMTLHASKGLEFDQVMIVGLEEGIFPHSRSIDTKADLEEERRLCYVGMTRARKHLHLSFTNSRMYFGTRSQNLPSRFIDELPSEVTDTTVSNSISSTNSTGVTRKPKPVDDQTLNDFLAGKIPIDEFLDS